MIPDYPAAHSMDTTWFAIDRCGHVAVFDSGEEGAVPEDAPDPYETLGAHVPFQGELDRCLREEVIVPGRHETGILNSSPNYVEGFYLLGPGLKARMLRGGDPEYRWHLVPVFGTTDGRDWARGALGADSWRRLHEMPHRCLGCTSSLYFDFDKRTEALRIIRYGCDRYGAAPYERVTYPIVPAMLEELQTLIGRPLPAAPKFDQFCFRDKRILQPLQWLPSRTYGNETWIDEEGKQRGTPP